MNRDTMRDAFMLMKKVSFGGEVPRRGSAIGAGSSVGGAAPAIGTSLRPWLPRGAEDLRQVMSLPVIVATAELHKSRGFCLAGDVYWNIRLTGWVGGILP